MHEINLKLVFYAWQYKHIVQVVMCTCLRTICAIGDVCLPDWLYSISYLDFYIFTVENCFKCDETFSATLSDHKIFNKVKNVKAMNIDTACLL